MVCKNARFRKFSGHRENKPLPFEMRNSTACIPEIHSSEAAVHEFFSLNTYPLKNKNSEKIKNNFGQACRDVPDS